MTVDERGVEAAARALCEADGVDPSDQSSWLTDEPLWTEYVSQARAAITAYESARSAEPVAGNDEIRDFWRQWAARRLEISRTHWLRASERALNGDMRELRLRVEQAKAPQVQIVASAHPTPEASDV